MIRKIIYEEDGSKWILGCKLNKFNAWLIIFGFIFCITSYLIMNNKRFIVSWNLSESLPYTFFVVDKNKMPSKNDIGAFNYYSKAKYVSDFDKKLNKKLGIDDSAGDRVTFIKYVGGVEGDFIKVQDRKVYLNDEFVGKAKENAELDKRMLYPLSQVGVIPKHKYYLKAPHQDSFDSRYSEVGLIDESEIIGKAYGFF